jgi:hypothetical protein
MLWLVICILSLGLEIFLRVLLTWFTESAFSCCKKNCVMKKIISLIIIFCIYCENRMEHKNTVRIKMQGFFMLELGVLTFTTALHNNKYFLNSFSLDSLLRGFSSLVTKLWLKSRRLVFMYLLLVL